MASLIFVSFIVLVILTGFVALPLAEMVLARQAHAHFCGIEAESESETAHSNGMATAFLLMDFVRMEEALEFANNVTYISDGDHPVSPLFAIPANDK